ncbi:MAG: sigma-70 family RNA polymerase sigma factor [Planctomycetes bacterium]|nr:sigma-70 family RNA polymerase sigma factor [Planctomycetota bacterium]
MGTCATTIDLDGHPPTLEDRNLAASAVTHPPMRDTVSMSARATTFHELYAKYAEDVHRFAHWLSGNADDARDIASETFVRAWTSPGEPRMESVKAYLFAIARNLHLKQLRRASRYEALDEGLSKVAAAPHEVAEHRDDFQRTMAAVQALPEIDRAVLLLRAKEELSYQEISEVTGLSVTAAKVKVFRAREKLAAILKSHAGEST